MLKVLMLLTFLISTNAFSAEPLASDFEAELRALETNQLKTEELQMRNADAVTDVVSDEVGTGQASTVRSSSVLDNSDIDLIPTSDFSEKKPSQVERERRVRSR